ncbi:unnamed protein product [Amoebophrya sp. A120]|nr:unnamed protein product [Amoebophrya sp. A120]|eukprot:GSA120T00021686001.1
MSAPSRENLWEMVTAYPPPTPTGMVPMGATPTIKKFFRDAHRSLLLAAQNKRNCALAARRLQQLGQEVRTNANRTEAAVNQLEENLFNRKVRLLKRVRPRVVQDCEKLIAPKSLWQQYGSTNRPRADEEAAKRASAIQAQGNTAIADENAARDAELRRCEQLANFLLHDPGPTMSAAEVSDPATLVQ